jgi:CO/xanthine dehydrogenase FAD-binding subunit
MTTHAPASKIEAWMRPDSLEEALSILALKKGDVAPLGGSTSISRMPGLQKRFMMDLRGAGLGTIQIGDGDAGAGGALIGATASLSELGRHEALNAAFCGVFARVADTAASEPLRNMITAGGNAFQAFTWSELPPILLALNASFEFASKESRRALGADDFYAGHPRTKLRADELLTGIRIPLGDPKLEVIYDRFSLARNDYAAVTCAVAIRGDEARVAVGGLFAVPKRIRGAEAHLAETPRADWDIAAIRAAVCDELPKIQNHVQFTPEYRREVAGNLVGAQVEALKGGCGCNCKDKG